MRFANRRVYPQLDWAMLSCNGIVRDLLAIPEEPVVKPYYPWFSVHKSKCGSGSNQSEAIDESKREQANQKHRYRKTSSPKAGACSGVYAGSVESRTDPGRTQGRTVFRFCAPESLIL